MFIDRTRIEVRSGKGGDGAIAFLREKYVPFGGPAGGNGGRGASIILKANKSMNTLIKFRNSKTFIAPPGEKGGTKNKYGKSMEDIYIDVPVGTVVFEEPEHIFIGDLNEDGKTLLVAKGGRGGRGNTCFKSAVNRVPRIAENGEPGQIKKLTLELKLLADVGVVGFPSVGKSTLLSVVSAARPEIADYPFTTLAPNLGVVSSNDGRSFVMADLPGLIEGAHLGKGLGLTFLRHIERCRLIVHMVSMDGERDPYDDYKTINNELKSYGFGLNKRPMIIVASKMDEEGAVERLKIFKAKIKKPVVPISSLAGDGLEELIYKCLDVLEKTKPFPLYDERNKDLGVKVYTLEAEKEYAITKLDANNFVIGGEKIERFYKMTNISTDEGMLKLLTNLRAVGINDELEKMGAKNGDTVKLCDFEFEYIS